MEDWLSVTWWMKQLSSEEYAGLLSSLDLVCQKCLSIHLKEQVCVKRPFCTAIKQRSLFINLYISLCFCPRSCWVINRSLVCSFLTAFLWFLSILYLCRWCKPVMKHELTQGTNDLSLQSSPYPQPRALSCLNNFKKVLCLMLLLPRL